MNERFSVNGKPKASQKPAPTEFEVRSKTLRSKIGERVDHLTGLWREIEKKLLGLQQPRYVYYVYHTDYHGDPNQPHGDHDHLCIGIAKYAGKWRLCLGEFNEYHHWHHDTPISWCPVTDSTMEERIAVAQYVKELEKKIVETGEEILPKLDEAIRHLEDGLAGI